ncbi:MAG: 50S ribosomal protein L4 [Weeksellaceae bacterium]
MAEAAVKKTPVKKVKAETVKTETVKAEAALSLPVYDITGKQTGTQPVSEAVFGKSDNPELLAQYVRVYETNQRQGNASTKTRSEITGTTKKVYRQKGTGRARHGSKKAPIFVGGGTSFGPHTRTFSVSMNKKQRKLALYTALSNKLKYNKVAQLDAAALTMKPETKTIAACIKAMEMNDKKLLFVLPKMEKNGLVLSARNMKTISFVPATTLNPYEVINTNNVVFVGEAVQELVNHFEKQA